MDNEIYFGTHIRFVPGEPKPKTKVWWIEPKDGSGRIGRVAWYGPWRKYCFDALPNTTYEQVCLREIADFCETRTQEHGRP